MADAPQAQGSARAGSGAVAAGAGRSSGQNGLLSRDNLWKVLPVLIALAIAIVYPFESLNDWLRDLPAIGEFFPTVGSGVIIIVFTMMAIGLNVVVGYAGLLDLGYVALFGFGAYFYALLSSDHYGIHWPAEASIPVVMVAAALLGLVLGIPSRRLLGDYLAIVTLFFGQAFVLFVNTANPTVAGIGLTGGPNGIADVDPLAFFGYELTSKTQYFYFLLGTFVVVMAALYFLSESRTGRAWRAVREDPLAAAAMSIPVNRVKLLAFSFGAALAGLTGCIFAGVQTGVFPGNFDVSLLILIYAVVVLGGIGSLAGAVVGAVIINVSFELFASENPQDRARWLFYGVILLLVAMRTRPWWRAAAVLVATVAFGLVVHTIVDAVAPSWAAGSIHEGSFLEGPLADWVIIPTGHGDFGNYAYVGLVIAILVVTRLHGWWRTAALVPTLYLVAIVWENILVQQPAVARLILFGALLIALMSARPQGLLGTPRVEIA
jgi:branched-chain amino acid transport system permease protein